MELTNSLFGDHKKINVYEGVARKNFQGPVIKYDSLDPYSWAGNAITGNGLV